MAHATHVPAALQMGLVPEHWPLLRHATHVPAALQYPSEHVELGARWL